MFHAASLYSALQFGLLLCPYVLLIGGIWVWIKYRRRKALFAWGALAIPAIIFLVEIATTYVQHRARTAFLDELIKIPAEFKPGTTLVLTMGYTPPRADLLISRGLATQTLTAIENADPWTHVGANSPVLELNNAQFFHLDEDGTASGQFAGGLDDIDYVYITGPISDFIEADPNRWAALRALDYQGGIVSLIYDVSDARTIDLIQSRPIFRYASTRSVYFQLPNWSTDRSLHRMLQWENWTPTSNIGRSRYDILTMRVALQN